MRTKMTETYWPNLYFMFQIYLKNLRTCSNDIYNANNHSIVSILFTLLHNKLIKKMP